MRNKWWLKETWGGLRLRPEMEKENLEKNRNASFSIKEEMVGDEIATKEAINLRDFAPKSSRFLCKEECKFFGKE